MHHNYIRTRKLPKRALFAIAYLVLLVVFFCKEDEALNNRNVSVTENTQITYKQADDESFSTQSESESRIVVALIPTPSELALESSSTTSLPSSSNNIQVKHTQDATSTKESAPVRENKLYYFMENGTRTDIPVKYQDYLYDLLKDRGHEDKYKLAMAMIYYESGWKPDTISEAGDFGLAQINKHNHAWLKKTLNITNFLDPYQSMKAGMYILCGLFDKYDDAEYALVCYNMGEGGAKRKGARSTPYSRGVLADTKLLVELEQ